MRTVCIGGGTGLACALVAVRELDPDPTAVVSIVDDGGSSGRLVAQRGGLPPGDLRKCLVALLPEASPWAPVLEHRFKGSGSLNGHALGNLLLIALEERGGNLASAAADMASLIGCRGRVLPVSLDPHVLVAQTASGIVRGQEEVNYSPGIRRIWVDPSEPTAYARAVDAIMAADAVLIGPGSLFTSVIPPFLVPGVRDAVAACTARRIFVANLAPQVAETRHLDLAGHVRAFLDHGGEADLVLYDPASPLGDPGDLPLPAVTAAVAHAENPALHEPRKLGQALRRILSG